MDVHPGTRGLARLWHHIEPGFAAVSVWTERIADHGEDADPLVVLHRPSGRGLLGVFDGVGGAGRSTAGTTASGDDRTQAWVASRRVRGLVEEWFVRHSSTTGLEEHIASRLGRGATENKRLRGSIRRDFPTTLAALDFRVTATEVWWNVLWAGDSRGYVAEPGQGLQQLSRDDTDSADALELLVQDPPMTNMVSASHAFAINRWRGTAALPCLLLCSTDGFFGYVDTPAQFEHFLWQTLLSAQDLAHWGALLTEGVEAYTGDDASLALVALGFHDFSDISSHFWARAERIRVEHGEPMSQVRPGDQAGLRAAREYSWARYRAGYECRLP